MSFVDNTIVSSVIYLSYNTKYRILALMVIELQQEFLDLHFSISNGFVSPKFMINAMTLILI